MKHARITPIIMAAGSMSACFAHEPAQVQEKRNPGSIPTDSPTIIPQQEDVPSTVENNVISVAVDIADATASVLSLASANVANAIGAASISVPEGKETHVTFTLQAFSPSGETEIVLIKDAGEDEIRKKIVLRILAIVDKIKKTVSFPVRKTGWYAIAAPEQPPPEDAELPTFRERQNVQWLQYSPTSNTFVSSDAPTIAATASNPLALLQESDIASLSIRATHGDNGNKDPRNRYHFLKFFYFAYNLSVQKERVKREWESPLLFAYDTRRSIDFSASLRLSPITRPTVNIGMSMGGLVNRTERALQALAEKNETGSPQLPAYYLGDITWASGHHGLMLSHPKWARAAFQGMEGERRFQATSKTIGYAAQWHNLGSSLNARPTKGAEDPIRQFGYDFYSAGHRSFFPSGEGDRYPEPPHEFLTWYSFGPLTKLVVKESISFQDKYGLRCGGEVNALGPSVQAVAKIQGNECTYNLVDALTWLENSLGISRTQSFIFYAGYFGEIGEMQKEHTTFDELLGRELGTVVRGEIRGAELSRRWLAWSQLEQGWYFPSPSLDKRIGDGFANVVTALKLKGGDPIFRRLEGKIEPDKTTVESRKPDDAVTVRAFRGVSHADFAGDDTDSLHEFTPRMRDVYEQTIADMFWFKERADAPPPDTARNALPTLIKSANPTVAPERFLDFSILADGENPRYATVSYAIAYRYPEEVSYKIQQRKDRYAGRFRWWNGRWWFWQRKPLLIS